MSQVAALLLVLSAASATAERQDPTDRALQACLDAPDHASTAGQTECEAVASRDYDRRMNLAYAGLMRGLPTAAATRLRTAQRAWLAFRSSEQAALASLYESRQGTMYVPMRAAAMTDLVRSRALQLETSLRVLEIED